MCVELIIFFFWKQFLSAPSFEKQFLITRRVEKNIRRCHGRGKFDCATEGKEESPSDIENRKTFGKHSRLVVISHSLRKSAKWKNKEWRTRFFVLFFQHLNGASEGYQRVLVFSFSAKTFSRLRRLSSAIDDRLRLSSTFRFSEADNRDFEMDSRTK